MPRPSQPNNAWSVGVQHKLLIVQFSPVFFYFLRVRPKHLPQHLILQHPLLPHSVRESVNNLKLI